MTEPKKEKKADKRHGGSSGASRKRPVFNIIPGAKDADPTQRKPPRIQLVGADERLTPEERKRRFATNLDTLIELLGRTRKEVADEIGVAHKLVLRLVSAGISRTDDRNEENLTKIAAYFGLPSVEDFWSADLIRLILPADGSGDFVERFRPRLLAERERRLAEESSRRHDQLNALSGALGFEVAPPTLTGPLAAKLATILASPKAEQFKRVIDDYFDLAMAQKQESLRK